MSEALIILVNIHFDLMISNILKQYGLNFITYVEYRG